MHPHRPARKCGRNESGIGSGVVRRIVTVAARALHVDAAHTLFGQTQHFGDRLAQGIDALSMRPDGQHPVLQQTDRAGRTDRRMHLVWPMVVGCNGARADAGCRHAAGNHRVLRRKAADVSVEVRLRWQGRPLFPTCRFGKRAASADGLIFALGNNRDKIAVAHDFQDTGQALDPVGIERAQPRAVTRWAHNARMYHAGQPEILHVACHAGELGGNVDAL